MNKDKDPIEKVVSVNELKLHPENPRTITERKFNETKESVREFSKMTKVRKVVVNEDMVILGGQQRYLAMRAEGYKEVPVTIVVDWTEEEQREFMVKDNTHAGVFDMDILANRWTEFPTHEWGINHYGAENFYAPELDPEQNNRLITDKDVDKVKPREFDNNVEMVDVQCPHCGVEFKMDRIC